MAKVSDAAVAQVHEVLSGASHPLTARQIAAELNMHPTTASDALRQLVKARHVERELAAPERSGRRPYLYSTTAQPTLTAVESPAAPSAEPIRFRGKSACRAAYILVTGSTYGKGARPSADAILKHRSLQRFNEENRYNAIAKLVELGVLKHVGQVNKLTGRAHRKYEVLVERDPNFDVKGKARPAKRKSRAKVKVKSAPVVHADLDLEVRVAQLEARVAELVAALRSV